MSKTKIAHRPTGWNTWDFRGFNRLTYLKQGKVVISVRYAIWDEAVPPPEPDSKKIGELYQQFRWEHVTRLGPHAPLGLPARLEFKAGDVPYVAEALEKGGTLRLAVSPQAETVQRVVFILEGPAGESPERKSSLKGKLAGCDVRFQGATWPKDYFVNIAEPYAIAGPGQPATVLIKPARAKSSSPGTSAALAKRTLLGEGALADAPGAMMQAIYWNTLYDSRRGLVSSPVSRDWCYDWRGVLVFCWDTYLVSAMMSYETPELARLNQETVTAAIDELGFVPNYYMSHGAASRDRSMPPVGAYLVWKTQQAAPDRAWLARIYPRLTRWHRFWMKHRNGRDSGLLSWGSDPVEYQFPQLVPYNNKLQHSRQAAIYESGLDNSPMYDDVEFDQWSNCLKIDDVGLSSLFALDCESLFHMANFLGKKSDAARYRAEYRAMVRRINDELWSHEEGIYCNRHWDGRHSDRWSPTSLFPLIAGVAPPERAELLVEDHLLEEKRFWGRWVIPSIARDDPAYKDNDYWRGRIWGPFNFLVAEGLRRYRYDDVAAELAAKSLDLFMTNWRKDGGVYENYNAETGEGADVWNAARLYHWGGLLAFVAMQELIDVEQTGYLRFGSLDSHDATLKNVRLGSNVYDITLGERVTVRKNDRPLLDCTTRAIIRIPLGDPAGVPLELSARDGGRLRLFDVDQAAGRVRLNEGRVLAPTRSGALVTYTW